MSNPVTAWIESPASGRTPLTSVCSIGRTVSNNFVLVDDRVSRQHASIYMQGDHEYWVADLGSANGTYLNGRRMTQSIRLSDGDRISIGGHVLVFRQPHRVVAEVTDRSTEKTLQDIRTLNCWLFVADLEGHTQMVQKLPPDEVSRVTGLWLDKCKQLIEPNGGVINKFLGDGFFAYWNAEDSGVIANLTASLAALTRLQADDGPRFRWVLHQGRVFSGGHAFGEESIMGGEVNFVFRMEKLAGKLGLLRLLSERATQILGGAVEVRDAGRHALAGFDGDTRFFTT